MKTFACLSAVGVSLVIAITCAAGTAVSTSPTAGITLRDFKLVGDLGGDRATFTLSAVAKAENSKGGTLDLLSGSVALTDLGAHAKWGIRAEQNRYVLTLDRSGEFPIQLKFAAAVHQADSWNAVDFRVAPGALQSIVLQGLGPDTQFQFAGAARPERTGTNFTSFLPSDGTVKLAWKEARKAEEGKLFYAAEMLSQINVSPGLMRQVAFVDFKVMQGEVNRVALLLRGDGEVTRVVGDHVLAWNVEKVENSDDRRLAVQLNEPQKDLFAVRVEIQTALGAFPQKVTAVQVRPEGATRFAGYFRIVNEGAVRLEVVQASGLSQISPEQFPENNAMRAALRDTGSQRFAYRFSGADFALGIQADQILPEIGVSEVLDYHNGQNGLTIEAEIELDIREAPLRELLIHVPKGFALTPPNASGMSDYFLRELEGEPQSELRLVYGQPVSGRQLVQLRLERNQPLSETNWVLPRVEVVKAKSVRGNVGVSADAGFRLTPEPRRLSGLTEIATAFFPRKVAGIQSAFRINEGTWQATMRVERLPQTVQADGFNLFSIGEGIAYGSSLMTYAISGAPMSSFRVELSDEYFNVEFAGKDIRTWQKTTNGYLVQLHSPVSGAYTLLATYERPFKAHGETLAFTGARPLDAQSEKGYTLVISAYQFQVKPVGVSPGLLPLETGEVPPEFRLFFDAPILTAYRYTSRPFDLRLALSPLAQGDSLRQVVDRASITNRISKEGQVLGDVRYFLKNRGNPNFRLTLPAGTDLWSVTVDGAAVVPVKDGSANLIPLPQRADPNALMRIDLKLASTSSVPTRVHIAAPIVSAPVMLAEWQLEPDAGQRLIFNKGSLTPVGGVVDVSGFAQLMRTFTGYDSGRMLTWLLAVVVLMGAALVVWRWACREGVYKLSTRHLTGTALGILALVLAGVALVNLANAAQAYKAYAPRDVTLLAPVQQPESALSVEVANVPDKATVLGSIGAAWPVLLALVAWAYAGIAGRGAWRSAGAQLGWILAAWAALRSPNGAGAFLLVIVAFLLLHVVLPALRRLWQLPDKPDLAPRPATENGTAPAITALLLGGLAWLSFAGAGCTSTHPGAGPKVTATEPALAESITQDIRVEDKFVLATVRIRWQAAKDQRLPLVSEPAVLTQLKYPARTLKLVPGMDITKPAQELLALESGTFDVVVQYQLQTTRRDPESGFTLPTQFGLVNQLTLTVVGLDVDVVSPQAVSVRREAASTNTVATLVLAPGNNTWIAWKPRSRDVKREKPVFYAELSQLYVPSAGVVEGAHYVAIRPAQGELSELVFELPRGTTVTDVMDGSGSPRREQAPATTPRPEPRIPSSVVSLWRFDPDTRKLRVSLSPPQSRPFAVLIRTQVPTGPLPFEQSVGLVLVEGSASQNGLLGVATGNEVQLDAVAAEAFSPINLEDFPAEVGSSLAAQVPGLTVRRAFRYSDTQATALRATASLKASAVEPDVRVETQDTLSLGEDRTVLAANATVEITRAGIFRLSFVMPAGFDVESISGPALSHWTEVKSDAGRIITLNLRGKTLGRQSFTISLAGPGAKATNAWTVPELVLREAGKHNGTLLIVPEQGMQLQSTTLDGLSQLDPQRSGIRQKGVLAFRILQAPWSLALKIEQEEPWIQVTSLQHATVAEAQVKVAANLQYQIETTGLKAFHVYLPTNAEGVHFQGELVGDFMKVEGAITNGLQEWEVKLQRRVIGQYFLQVNYQTPMPEQASETVLRGVQAADVNLQRGFVTVQSSGRLEVRPADGGTPVALQPTEWQSIPRVLQARMAGPPASANFTYRLVEPAFDLPLKLDRHEATKLLPARVNDITLTSLISDAGVMLTQVRLDMVPGDMRLLHLKLPPGAQYWFAFVNQSGVWPWRAQDEILIPLEQQSRAGKAITVEVFYSSPATRDQAGTRALDLELVAPKFDLPLEHIAWHVYLNEKWQVAHWTGTLQFQQQQLLPHAADLDMQNYLQSEAVLQREKTQEAEQMLALANNALEQGNPQQARRAFQAAYGLSTADAAFNEDARVQLHNLKLQQALVGLNVRQAAVAGESTQVGLGGRLRDLRGVKDIVYTQQDANDIFGRNSADDNAAFVQVATKLVAQQDAAVSSPAAIRASIPEQGRLLTFTRAVAVDTGADLRIGLEARAARAASWSVRVTILAGTLLILSGFGLAARAFRRREPEVTPA